LSIKKERKDAVENTAATNIQKTYRGYKTKQEYDQKKNATISIQTAWRGRLARCDFLKSKSASVKLQCLYRGFHIRKDIKKQKEAAESIQSFFRGKRRKESYNKKKSAVVVLQRMVRGVIARKKYKLLKNLQQEALVKEEDFKNREESEREAAIMIQKFYRGHQTRHLISTSKDASASPEVYEKNELSILLHSLAASLMNTDEKVSIEVQKLLNLNDVNDVKQIAQSKLAVLQLSIGANISKNLDTASLLRSMQEKLDNDDVIHNDIASKILTSNESAVKGNVDKVRAANENASSKKVEKENREKIEKDKAEKEKAENDKAAHDKADKDKAAKEKAAKEKAEKAEIRRIAREKEKKEMEEKERQAAANDIQRMVRGLWGRNKANTRLQAVLKIQKNMRTFLYRKKYINSGMRDALYGYESNMKASKEYLKKLRNKQVRMYI
jgi:hypothetical protein